jgi:hypothetical protein
MFRKYAVIRRNPGARTAVTGESSMHDDTVAFGDNDVVLVFKSAARS